MAGSSLTRIGSASSQACPDRAVAFIRALYPVKTAECVAADIGLPVHTVKRWLEGVARPSWDGIFALICAYGPRFLAVALPAPPAWVSDAAREQELAELRAEQARITKKLEALGA
jgi:hypothetical protein